MDYDFKTQEQMAKELNAYCDMYSSHGRFGCEGCRLEPVCSECYGAFEQERFLPHCIKAYDLLQEHRKELNLNKDVTDTDDTHVESTSVEVVHDSVNHPKHYCREGAMECIDEMVLIFGNEAVKHFCVCNAWKYRFRASEKNGDEDLRKSDWYINKFKELSDNV